MNDKIKELETKIQKAIEEREKALRAWVLTSEEFSIAESRDIEAEDDYWIWVEKVSKLSLQLEAMNQEAEKNYGRQETND
jgi:hypothetical protein